jgi:hypothetical protein
VQAQRQTRKGKTLEQIEAEEGGPIKESLVGMAHTKRTLKRKGGAAIGAPPTGRRSSSRAAASEPPPDPAAARVPGQVTPTLWRRWSVWRRS